MNHDPLELLSALLDGEDVDPRELAVALTAPGAREALRDFAFVRAEIRDDGARPSHEFYERMKPALGLAVRPRLWHRVVTVPAPAMVALLVVAVGLSAWIVTRPTTSPGPEALPPVPQRVLHFEPGVDWQFSANAQPTKS
ncbi:MAG TPA: hypothetical protein VJS92_10960 [Candidatus Polarisedimenticolaceae bacterium]|nr:hypothetical protein [Candidatus Polarisedimenticolaceae bacterium]